MSTHAAARLLLFFAALYDGLLGLAFLLGAPAAAALCGISAPAESLGYVHFSAALLVIFGLMFLAAALRPVRNRNLILYGILLKVAYIGVVMLHWANGGVPFIFKVFLLCDVVWFFVLAWTHHALGRPVRKPVK